MTLATLSEVLSKANKENYAVGAFNVFNLETIHAVINTAEAQNSPLILQTSTETLNYAGFQYLTCVINSAAKSASVPIAVHLDHATDLNLVKKCIDAGYTSVMLDGSHFQFEKNIELTAKAVQMAHAASVSVEGELGTIGGAEDNARSREIILTDPLKAKEFVKKTGVDALAVAIGTSHGAYKFVTKEQQLDIRRLVAIKKELQMPLVLHGASVVPTDILELATNFGAFLAGASGLKESELQRAVKNGINKVNTDTDLRLAFTAALRQTLMKNPREFDPRKLLTPSMHLIQKVVEDRMKLLKCAGKA